MEGGEHSFSQTYSESEEENYESWLKENT